MWKAKINEYVETWKNRGYEKDIPDEAPEEIFHKVPSYKKIAISILNNDITLLGFSRKKSIYYSILKKIEIDARNKKIQES